MMYNGRRWDQSNDTKFAQAPADTATTDHYRDQMRRMFGDNMVPAVISKGNFIPPHPV